LSTFHPKFVHPFCCQPNKINSFPVSKNKKKQEKNKKKHLKKKKILKIKKLEYINKYNFIFKKTNFSKSLEKN